MATEAPSTPDRRIESAMTARVGLDNRANCLMMTRHLPVITKLPVSADFGCCDHFGPLRVILRHSISKPIRRTSQCTIADRVEPLSSLVVVQDIIDGVIEPGYD